MKKLIILATLFFLMTGCGSTDESINFEVATADKTVRLTSQDDSPMCSVHLELSYAT